MPCLHLLLSRRAYALSTSVVASVDCFAIATPLSAAAALKTSPSLSSMLPHCSLSTSTNQSVWNFSLFVSLSLSLSFFYAPLRHAFSLAFASAFVFVRSSSSTSSASRPMCVCFSDSSPPPFFVSFLLRTLLDDRSPSLFALSLETKARAFPSLAIKESQIGRREKKRNFSLFFLHLNDRTRLAPKRTRSLSFSLSLSRLVASLLPRGFDMLHLAMLCCRCLGYESSLNSNDRDRREHFINGNTKVNKQQQRTTTGKEIQTLTQHL